MSLFDEKGNPTIPDMAELEAADEAADREAWNGEVPSGTAVPPPVLETINGKPALELPCAGRPLGEFAAELGAMLAGAGVYDRNGLAFRVDRSGKKLEAVSPQWLRTWAEQTVCCYVVQRRQHNTVRLVHSMTVDVGNALVVAPQFLDALPKLARFQPVRMPVMRADGQIELLPAGFDAPTLTLTDEAGCRFRTDMDGAEALEVLGELLGEFPFADERSRAVAVSAMVTVFAGGLLPRGATVPCFVFMGNAEGSGKTTAAKLAALPYGAGEVRSAPASEAEWQKRLLALVMSGRRLLILDNVRGHLNSPSLEAYLSATTYGDRILGVNKEFEGEADAVVLVTGNGLTVTPDLRRRSLFCELFMRELRAEERTFVRRLDDTALLAWQPLALGALWGLVRKWDAAGRPPASRESASFPRWCETVGAIVEHGGFACPTTPAELESGGDEATRDIAELGGLMEPRLEYTFGELVGLCEGAGLFERFTADTLGGELTPKARSRFGKVLGTYSGRYVAPGTVFLAQGKGHARRYVTHPSGGGTQGTHGTQGV